MFHTFVMYFLGRSLVNCFDESTGNKKQITNIIQYAWYMLLLHLSCILNMGAAELSSKLLEAGPHERSYKSFNLSVFGGETVPQAGFPGEEIWP